LGGDSFGNFAWKFNVLSGRRITYGQFSFVLEKIVKKTMVYFSADRAHVYPHLPHSALST
jgi:hypothetical protein